MKKIHIGELSEAVPGKAEFLDIKDKKILYTLNKNGRLNLSSVAKLVGLSREVVKYRLDQLEDKGILNGYVTLVDVIKLGLQRRVVFLRLQNFSKEQEIELIEKIVEIKRVIWVATTSGKWDIGLVIYSKDLEDFDKTFNNIRRLFGKLVVDFIILDEIINRRCNYNLLLEGFDFEPNIKSVKDSNSFENVFDSKKEKVDVDEKDIDILKVLVNNARAQVKEIAKQTRMSEETVKSRIAKLINGEIINGFTPQISFAKLGYEWHWLFLRVNTTDPKTDAKIKEYCQQHPNITWYVKHVGQWNWELSIFTKDSAQLRETINQIRKEFYDIIEEYDSLLVFNQFKYMTLLD